MTSCGLSHRSPLALGTAGTVWFIHLFGPMVELEEWPATSLSNCWKSCVCVCLFFIYIYVFYIICIYIYITWYIWPSAHPYVWKYVGTLEIASDDNTFLQVASPRLQGSMSKAKAVLAARPVAGGAWENSITSFGQH